MIPESLGALIAFSLLIAPGYTWAQQSAKYKPEEKVTPLQEVAKIVFSSIIPSTLAAAAFFKLWRNVLAIESNTLHIISASLLTSTLACLLVLIWSQIHFRKERKTAGSISGGSTLFKALVRLPNNTQITQVVATVRLNDGTIWRGHYASHDVGAEESPRMLLLKPPLSRKNKGSKRTYYYRDRRHVAISLDNVSSVELSYLTGSSDE